MKKYAYAALTICLLPSIASAGWLRDKQIEYVYSGDVGQRTAIKFVGETPSSACAVNGDYVFDESSPKFPWLWTLVIASFSKGNPIDVYVEGCGSYNSPLIKDVIIKRIP